jgi:hypothetical protein
MEEGDQTDIILLDFAKAFDKVPHDRLLYEMEFYGVLWHLRMLLQVSHLCMPGTIADPSRYLEELRRQRQVDLTCGSQVLRTEFCWSGHSSIMDHFDRHQVLCDEQHGFRVKRSCESQLLITIDDIARNMEEGEVKFLEGYRNQYANLYPISCNGPLALIDGHH